ncbi:MAG TPA: hypothetical protein DDW88_03310, partial [Treponema sp.]|nr:hypothetical protein [Treponema sp.]
SIPLGDVKTDCIEMYNQFFFYLFAMDTRYIDAAYLSHFLKTGGSLDSQFDYFEQRDSQIALLEKVTSA